jgi:hypothetical protein
VKQLRSSLRLQLVNNNQLLSCYGSAVFLSTFSMLGVKQGLYSNMNYSRISRVGVFYYRLRTRYFLSSQNHWLVSTNLNPILHTPLNAVYRSVDDHDDCSDDKLHVSSAEPETRLCLSLGFRVLLRSDGAS